MSCFDSASPIFVGIYFVNITHVVVNFVVCDGDFYYAMKLLNYRTRRICNHCRKKS